MMIWLKGWNKIVDDLILNYLEDLIMLGYDKKHSNLKSLRCILY